MSDRVVSVKVKERMSQEILFCLLNIFIQGIFQCEFSVGFLLL